MTCYLVAQINITTLAVDFQTALDDMRKMLAHPYYAWVQPILRDSH